MKESSKALKRRLNDSRFANRYFVGHGIDIGAGNDSLGGFAEHFPLMQSCQPWDIDDGDAQILASIADSSMDFVHSSHCLEHMRNPQDALQNWLRVLKPGGHLVVMVPDEDLYEQGCFPSTFNSDHKWTFTIHKNASWSSKSINLLDLLKIFASEAQILKIEQLDATYLFEMPRFDQSLTRTTECALEFVLRKRPADEVIQKGRFTQQMTYEAESAKVVDEVLKMYPQVKTNDFYIEIFDIAMQLYRAGHIHISDAICNATLKANVNSPDIFKDYGNLLLALGRISDAEDAYRKALLLKPEYGEVWNNLGNLLRLSGRLDDSSAAFQKAQELLPDRIEVYLNFGVTLMDLSRFEAAEKTYRNAIVLDADSATAHFGRANALFALRRWLAAEKSYRKSMLLNPKHSGAYSGLGNTLKKLLRFDEAQQAYQKSLEVNPNDSVTKYNLAMLTLFLGEYEAGFELYEHRFEGADKTVFAGNPIARIRREKGEYRLWNGESLGDQSLSVVTEQGAGDTLMMLRYLPLIKHRGVKHLAIYCLPQLERIVKTFNCVDEVIVDEAAMPPGAYCSLMSLPYIFKTTLETIPSSVPYIVVPDEIKFNWQRRLSVLGGLKIGLVWAGGKATKSDPLRSIPLSIFLPLLEIKGTVLVSLQKGEEAVCELNMLGLNIFDPMDECEDFLDTAALINELDIVISVDTSVAHLAGALGKPVWLLNRYESEWRWMTGRTDSPWYPTMRIFTQTRQDEWDSVIYEVKSELIMYLNKL